ncbi:hypothetical protein ILYODFUR_016750 [Ilyodon furcidens]|uniref:Uncharacterized protein n=1 Tax=Ilyodon furcidens TaxID=33524 RepID=A0ABV0TYY8_9TELE
MDVSGQVRLLVFGSSGAWRAASLSGSADSARKVLRTGSELGSSSRARKQDAGNHLRQTLRRRSEGCISLLKLQRRLPMGNTCAHLTKVLGST